MVWKGVARHMPGRSEEDCRERLSRQAVLRIPIRFRGSRSWSGKIFKLPLNEFASLLFVFLYFRVKRSNDVLDPETQPGSGSRALGLTKDFWHQKICKNKKNRIANLQNYLEYSFNKILNISHRRGTKPWIRIWLKPDPQHCRQATSKYDLTLDNLDLEDVEEDVPSIFYYNDSHVFALTVIPKAGSHYNKD